MNNSADIKDGICCCCGTTLKDISSKDYVQCPYCKEYVYPHHTYMGQWDTKIFPKYKREQLGLPWGENI